MQLENVTSNTIVSPLCVFWDFTLMLKEYVSTYMVEIEKYTFFTL